MKNKLLIVICSFLFMINIGVLADSIDDEGGSGGGNYDGGGTASAYCCNGVETKSRIVGQTCGPKKTSSCVKTGTITIKAVKKPERMSINDSFTVIGCNNGCTITNSSGGVISATQSKVTVVGNPSNGQCSQNVKVTYSREYYTIDSNGVKTIYKGQATFSFVAMAAWASTVEKNKVVWSNTSPSPTTKPQANQEGKNKVYEGCVRDPKYPQKWTCATIYTRGCSVPPAESPACYKENSTGFYYWGLYSGNKNYSLISSIKDYKSCVTKFECTTKYPNNVNNETPCNGQGEIDGEYVKKCDTIYTITCKENIKTAFGGPVLDSSMKETNNAYLYPGTGFKYNYSALSTLSCTGTFDNNRYKQVENYIKNYASSIGGSSTGSIDDKFYTSALEGLKQIKESYGNWKPTYKSKASVTINDDLKGKTFSTVTMTDKSNGLEKVSSCGSLPNGSINSFSYTEKNYFEKEMPMAYVNNKGTVVYQSDGSIPCTNCESIGKKFFVTSDRKYIGNNNYNYVVNATSLGINGYATDRTVCNLQLLDNGLIYRHVSLDDPFLQKTSTSHKIGYNWVNNVYNFVKIVKPDVWNDAPEYNIISLDPDLNVAIKNATKGNPNYYIGACTRGSANSQDIICRLLRNSMK